MYMYMLTSLLDQTTPPYMQGEHEEEWSGLRDYMLAFTSLSSESIALSALGGPYQRQCHLANSHASQATVSSIKGDRVSCFACKMYLYSWEATDEPW